MNLLGNRDIIKKNIDNIDNVDYVDCELFYNEGESDMKYTENSLLELKERINADFKKEIVAFANTDGGEILVGIAKDGSVSGVGDAEKEMERISNMIRDGIKPDLTPYTTVDAIEEDGKTLIRVNVSRGEKRPYHLSDKGMKPSGVYVRHGITSAPASEESIRQMIKESDGTTFDTSRSLNQDLTFQYAEQYFDKCSVGFQKANMRTLGLLNADEYFTNTALLLSDQCMHSIKCAVYDGVGKTKFRARKEFSGSILKQLEEAYEYINLNNQMDSGFEGLHRIDIYDYPQFAIREALLNTIVHRDYAYSGSTLINIFDDRMEFVSLGGLVKGLTLTDIMHGVSQSRNMVLAAVFYRLELIESYGTGIQRIIESYWSSNKKSEFIPAPASFIVILKNLNYKSQADYITEEKGVYLTDEEKVLLLLEAKGKISRKDVERLFECSSFPAVNALNRLLEDGKIIRVGRARATKYMLKS